MEQAIFAEFPFSPTQGQKELIAKLAAFLISDEELPLFLLEGYAGTGKTSVVSSLVKCLQKKEVNIVLLAPTGRAAKILSNYSQHHAFTIHKKIYHTKLNPDGYLQLSLQKNREKNTLFIIDEVSMIANTAYTNASGSYVQSGLLDDLIAYVYEGQNCKMLFIGDAAQLPPVGIDESPAMSIEYLKANYFLNITHHKLTDIVRQALDSGIVSNSMSVRKKIDKQPFKFPLFDKKNIFKDVACISGEELADCLQDTYSEYGVDNAVFITRSNKRANLFNHAIRQRILFRENNLSAGDNVMVVHNNYSWIPQNNFTEFIANGDILEILSLRNWQDMYNFSFVDATVKMVDYPELDSFDVKLLLDTITSENASLSFEEKNRLYQTIAEDYADIPSKKKRQQLIKQNPYYNALQIKHAYAMTCHKTQGGQWDVVFLEKGFLKEEMLNNEYLRWLYTAITRATKKLFLINFDDKFYK